ncbi:MAG TPA: hypothetical protein VIL65_04635 [Beijerinckiaceae bacterium]
MQSPVISHQVKSWFGSEISGVARHPTVQALAAKWMQIRTERDPTLADFWHGADEAFAAYCILFLRSEDDFVYLHHGTTLRARVGFSMQGRRLSELRTRVRERLLDIYEGAADRFEIAYFQSFADFQQDVVLWGRLCLPLRLSEDTSQTALLLYCHAIEDKNSIYRALFEHSIAGTIIGAPVRDGAGTITDAWIIAQNDRAAEFSGIRDHATSDLLLRHVPLFARDDVWSTLVGGAGSGRRAAMLVDEARGLRLRVSAELIDDYLVMRMATLDQAIETFTIGSPAEPRDQE